jgi:predicted HTH domain antitoxin
MKELTIKLPVEADEKMVKMLVAASLYENEILSSGQAAELVGISRREFLEEVGKYQVSIFGETPEDLERIDEIEF